MGNLINQTKRQRDTETETDRDRQRQTETERHRQTQTVRHRQTRSTNKPKINKNAQFYLLFQYQKLRLQRFSQTL